MAERERQRAHDSQAIGEPHQAWRMARDEVGLGRLEREDLDPLLGLHAAERLAVQARALAARSRPFLARPEVVDVAEDDVLHGRAFGNRNGECKEGDPALGVDGAVDRVDDDNEAAAVPRGSPAELLRDEREVRARGIELREDRVLRRRVNRGRVVAAEPVSDDGLALGARREVVEDLPDVLDSRPARIEPRAHKGWKSSPEGSLG